MLNQCFNKCHGFKGPLVANVVKYCVTFASFMLYVLENQVHIFCNPLKYTISSYIVNRHESMKMYLRMDVQPESQKG